MPFQPGPEWSSRRIMQQHDPLRNPPDLAMGRFNKDIFNLGGRVAVVTGGTTGLGHAIALGLAEAGADVVASSRRLEQVEKIAAEIEAVGRRTLRLLSDVSKRDSVQALHDAVMKEFGKVDILVNAAGITHKGPTLEVEEADWARGIETNLNGT